MILFSCICKHFGMASTKFIFKSLTLGTLNLRTIICLKNPRTEYIVMQYHIPQEWVLEEVGQTSPNFLKAETRTDARKCVYNICTWIDAIPSLQKYVSPSTFSFCRL